MIKKTHTYATMDISPAAHKEIHDKLIEAGYEHAIREDDGRTLIDMNGIALEADKDAGAILNSALEFAEQLALRVMQDKLTKIDFEGDDFKVRVRIKKRK